MKAHQDKPIVWLKGEVKSPPFSNQARMEAGLLLRRLQIGDTLGMPWSRPMPSIGPRCHELRVRDQGISWRLIYRNDTDAIIILDVFNKQTKETPFQVIQNCKRRLKFYDAMGQK